VRPVVLVHRLKGEPIFVNADLIESIEARPDTVMVLVDGRTLVLSDVPEEIVDRIRRFRASVLVAADDLRDGPAGPDLTVVRDADR
jgi:flagellar protein FlbD